MNKRVLSAIPRPELTTKQKEMVLLVPHISYLVTAQRQEIAEVDTLIMNFFRYEKKELHSAFRVFCQPEDYITQDLSVINIKWKTGAVNSLTGYLYWYKDNGNIVMASVKDRKTILNFLYQFKKRHNVDDYHRWVQGNGATVDTEMEDRIDEYQDTIKKWKLDNRHKKLKNEIDLQMEKYGAAPEDYDQFVDETVFAEEHYMFYSKKDGKAYCTGCQKTFEITKDGYLWHKHIPVRNDRDKVKHNHNVFCPYCHRLLACKSEGIGRGKLFAVKWSVLLQKYKGEVLVRYFCHTKDFRKDYKKPVVQTNELFRTIHTDDGVKDYSWDRFKSTQEVRWIEFKDRSYGYCSPPETVVPRSAVLYRSNLEEAIAETCMKYSALELYVDKIIDSNNYLQKPWCIDWYFNAYRKQPYLELLLKVGFYRMTKEILEKQNIPKFTNGKSVMEALQIDRIKYKMLANIDNPSIQDLKILRYAKSIKEDDFKELRYVHDCGRLDVYKKYIDLMEYTSLHKINKYFDKADITGSRVNDYFDYVGWLKELGYDMRNVFNLYPKHFQKSHDEKSKEYQAYQDKKKKQEMRRFNQIIKQMKEDNAEIPVFNMHYKGMLIRLPKNMKEIKDEGQTLHHCVGTYVEKVGKGETLILLIRREDNPEKPFYTLEWKGKVVQCQGMNHCNSTQEVQEFVNEFSEQMIAYEKSLNRKKQRKAG